MLWNWWVDWGVFLLIFSSSGLRNRLYPVHKFLTNIRLRLAIICLFNLFNTFSFRSSSFLVLYIVHWVFFLTWFGTRKVKAIVSRNQKFSFFILIDHFHVIHILIIIYSLFAVFFYFLFQTPFVLSFSLFFLFAICLKINIILWHIFIFYLFLIYFLYCLFFRITFFYSII
jgi:hypothetical protein